MSRLVKVTKINKSIADIGVEKCVRLMGLMGVRKTINSMEGKIWNVLMYLSDFNTSSQESIRQDASCLFRLPLKAGENISTCQWRGRCSEKLFYRYVVSYHDTHDDIYIYLVMRNICVEKYNRVKSMFSAFHLCKIVVCRHPRAPVQ